MEATQNQNKNKKERGGNTTILYSTLVLQSSTRTLVCREFSCCTWITKWGSLHYKTWLAYSKDEPPQKSFRSSWASKLDAPPLVPLESFLLTCASFAWQSLLLTSYLSYVLLSPMIVLIDVSLSHLFVFLIHLLSVSPIRCQLSCSRSSVAWELKISKGSGSVWLVPG